MERTKSTHLKNLLDRALSEKATLNAYLLIVKRKGKKEKKKKRRSRKYVIHTRSRKPYGLYMAPGSL